MATSVYRINKGINRPIEFKGLRAQYIAYLAVGLVGLLLLFTFLYLVGVALAVCLGITLLLGGALFAGVYYLNKTFGEHGLSKRLARRSIPHFLRLQSRSLFLYLNRKEVSHGHSR
ncbi:DUF4133 domain-containing protein [Pontibacter litorisediminis]|uniref:DUF4133 domain-containing protein n=1 Tax=Pontibacter litorisediminis TaxID=1846260 RepID=UPI0023EAA5C6|nr:DUF4133 domain-containing protein [Pontibacter litorisediminis]